jgi:hypothetical protein
MDFDMYIVSLEANLQIEFWNSNEFKFSFFWNDQKFW